LFSVSVIGKLGGHIVTRIDSPQRQSKSPLTTAPPVAQPAAGSSLPQNIPSTPIPVPGYAILRDHPYQPAVAQPISIPGTKAFSWQNTRPAVSLLVVYVCLIVEQN